MITAIYLSLWYCIHGTSGWERHAVLMMIVGISMPLVVLNGPPPSRPFKTFTYAISCHLELDKMAKLRWQLTDHLHQLHSYHYNLFRSLRKAIFATHYYRGRIRISTVPLPLVSYTLTLKIQYLRFICVCACFDENSVFENMTRMVVLVFWNSKTRGQGQKVWNLCQWLNIKLTVCCSKGCTEGAQPLFRQDRKHIIASLRKKTDVDSELKLGKSINIFCDTGS